VRERFEGVLGEGGEGDVGGGGVGSAAIGGEEEDLDLAKGVGCVDCGRSWVRLGAVKGKGEKVCRCRL